MSIFGSIMHKIFHHDDAVAAPADGAPSSPAAPSPAANPADPFSASAAQPAAQPGAAPATQPQATTTASSGGFGSAPAQPVDVDAVLTRMASTKGGGGNYRTSIVDLLKLLDLDSSLDARKQLADELDVHAGAPGTAEENVALHKAVMNKLAENGGTVPASLRS